jgi:aryl-alcohol dehydrogenase-like predicted oxidoreductase
MSNEGWATLEGTTRYRQRMNDRATRNHFHLEQNLWLSSIGIGTYLGNADQATDDAYEETVVQAVGLGVNVIDSASNYRFQRSERAIGRALQRLFADGCARDEIVVCTKGGYLPFDGTPPRDVRRYVLETFVEPGIASLADIVSGSHCMKPAYLENQMDQSLRNMGLSCIDVYYIHNPESQLGVVGHEEFFARLRTAFAQLEKNVAEGKIRMYGVATWNGFRVSPEARDYHSLEQMAAIAREVGGDSHGFRVIQLPLNLAMPEALTYPNQTVEGHEMSVLEAAAALGITTVASASILQGKVAQGLPETVREPLGSLATDAQTGIQFVRSTPGITTALVGMSNREHVAENLQLARVEPVHPEEFMRLFTQA